MKRRLRPAEVVPTTCRLHSVVLWFTVACIALPAMVWGMPQSVVVTSPANNSTISGACVPVIADAQAEQNTTITRIIYRIDGNLIPSAPNNPLQGLLDTRQYNNGFHFITAQAFDSRGESLTSAPIFTYIDNVQVLYCNATSDVVNVVFDADITAGDTNQNALRPEFYQLRSPAVGGTIIRIRQVTHRFDRNIPNTKGGLGGSVVTLSTLTPGLSDGATFLIRVLSQYDFDVPANGTDPCGTTVFGPEPEELFAAGRMSNINNTCSGVVATSRPTVVNCAALDNETVRVVFSRDVAVGGGGNAADNPNNYTLQSPIGYTVSFIGVEHDPLDIGSSTTFLLRQVRPKLIEGNTFRVIVRNVQDLVGNIIEENGSSNVCTGFVPDFTPPRVVSCSASNRTLTVTFSESLYNLHGEAIAVSHYSLESPPGYPIDLTNPAITVTYDDVTRSVTFRNLALTTGNQVRIEVNGVIDLAGNSIDANTDYSYKICTTTVTDNIPPRVIGCSASVSSVTVVFSEAMNQSDVLNPANYRINDNPLPQTATLTWDPTNYTVLIRGLTLQQGTIVTIVVYNVRDLQGNVIVPGGPDDRCSASVQDSTPPRVAECEATERFVRITFNEAMKAGTGIELWSVTNVNNYTLESPLGATVNIRRATLVYNPVTYTVILTLAPDQPSLRKGDSYKMTVRNVQDLAGNRIFDDGIGNVCEGTVVDSTPPVIDRCHDIRQKFIKISFSEDMNPQDVVNRENYYLEMFLKQNGIETGIGTPVPLDRATFTYPSPNPDDPPYTLLISDLDQIPQLQVFDPPGLPGNTRIQLTVRNVRDLSNISIINNGVDNVCQGIVHTPYITECLATQSAITITFSDDMIPLEAGDRNNYSVESPIGTRIDLTAPGITVTYDELTRTTTISGLNLRAGDDYKVTVRAIHDIYGGTVLQESPFNICPSGEVQDDEPPKVISCCATPNRIIIRFSEAMDPATASYRGFFKVESPPGTPKTGGSAYYDETTHETIIAPITLTLGRVVKITVTSGVKDEAGNAIDPKSNVITCIVVEECGGAMSVVGGMDKIDLVTFPVTVPYNDPSVLLNNMTPPYPWNLARWFPSQNDYQFSPDPDVRIYIGEGYWLQLVTDSANVTATIPLTGTPYRLDQSFEQSLPPNNWFIIGNPYLVTAPWDTSKIQYKFASTTARPLSDLIGNISRPVEVYAWTWNTSRKQYEMLADTRVIPAGAESVRRDLKIGEGAFFRTYSSGVSIIFPSPTGARSIETRQAGRSLRSGMPANPQHWVVELLAECGEAKNTGNLFGVNSSLPGTTGLKAASPPYAPDRARFVELTFLDTGTRRRAAGEEEYEVDLRPRAQQRETWLVKVVTDIPNTDVILRWSNLAGLPRQYRARLVDETTGAARAMRTTSFYSFRSNAQGRTERRFRIEIYPASEGGLRITNVQVMDARTRAANATASFVLNRDAQVRVRVLAPNGRVVRDFGGALARAGLNLATWDRRNAAGAFVPPGLYVLEIIAEDEEGQAFRAVRTLRIR